MSSTTALNQYFDYTVQCVHSPRVTSMFQRTYFLADEKHDQPDCGCHGNTVKRHNGTELADEHAAEDVTNAAAENVAGVGEARPVRGVIAEGT